MSVELYVLVGVIVTLVVATIIHLLVFTSGGNRLLGYGRYAVIQINIYPVKGMGPQRCASWVLDKAGFEYDRRFAVICDGDVVTQRDVPKLALLRPCVDLRRKELMVDGFLSVGLGEAHGDPYLLGSSLVVDCGDAASVWLTRELQRDDETLEETPVKKTYRLVRFLDRAALDAPLTVACAGSLRKIPVSMDRFRPNLVVETSRAFVEDFWATLKLSKAKLRVLSPTSRCLVTTHPQAREELNGGSPDEPLLSLTKLRRSHFGLNLGVDASSQHRVHLGDYLSVTRFRTTSWILDHKASGSSSSSAK